MSEDAKWKDSVMRDISNIHTSLQQVLQSLSLPGLPAPHMTTQDPAVQFDLSQENDHEDADEEEEQSYDNSPKLSPMAENVAQIPIESLYQITGLKSLRSTESVTDEQKRICKQLRDTDFISRGQISLEDAEQLASYYIRHLDPYFYNMTAQYAHLDDFRRRSPTLTAAILAVAALHDVSAKPELYPLCSKEFKRLVANAMFERKVDIEYLRALVVGSYWLSDVGWTMSGYAIRRASEFHLKTCYYQIADSLQKPTKYSKDQLQDARDGLRLLYLLYICDHHLSILYGRPSIMRDNEHYILGYENYLASSVASDIDKRVAAQVSLLLLMSQIRESLGPEEDTGVSLPESMLPKIKGFERDLDNWVLRWSNTHSQSSCFLHCNRGEMLIQAPLVLTMITDPNKHIGTFPTKGSYVHHYFSKIYLDAYVFRGLPNTSSSQTSVIPLPFVETASGAVAAAMSLVNIILGDQEIQVGLAGVPHYFYGMIAFACVFLVKAATKHSAQLFIDQQAIRVLIERLSGQLSATRVGSGHVIHRMAGGLRKMAESLNDGKTQAQQANSARIEKSLSRTQSRDLVPFSSTTPATFDPLNYNHFSVVDGTDLGFGDAALGFGMPFFDFEGTIDMSSPVISFPA